MAFFYNNRYIILVNLLISSLTFKTVSIYYFNPPLLDFILLGFNLLDFISLNFNLPSLILLVLEYIKRDIDQCFLLMISTLEASAII